MAKLGKQLKLKVTVAVLQVCPVCDYSADMVDNGDSYHLECSGCGVKGYRYETKALAIRDFPNHHGLPKKKVKGVV